MIFGADQTRELAQRVQQACEFSRGRVVVTVGGVPGSGKSTIAARVCQLLGAQCRVVPQDGFHYSRAELARFDDPQHAALRRGAPFTFNVEAFVALIKKLKDPQYADTTVYLPSFDHRLKDPVANDIVVTPDVRVVIVEGNYVSLDAPHWRDLAALADDTWFVEAAPDAVLERIVARHLASGVAATAHDARERAAGSDRQNANYILAHRLPTAVTIQN